MIKFKQFDFNKDRTYEIGKLTFDDFYVDGSVNDKFKVFLNKKYEDEVDCYIKPFGCHNDVTSFGVQMVDHNNTYGEYWNQVHVVFSRVENSDDSYVLGCNIDGVLKHKVNGYSKKLAEQLFLDAIEFLDSTYRQIQTA